MKNGTAPGAILFDMDGVLFDSEAMHVRAWLAVFGRHALGIGEEEIQQWVGRPDAVLVENLRGRFPAVDVDAVFVQKTALFIEMTTAELAVFDGLVERIEALQSRGLTLVVATSTVRAEADRMLTATGLAGYFPELVTFEDVARHKPAPDAYLEAARRAGFPPARCIAIEDSPFGLESARAAGCLPLGVTTTWPAARLASAEKLFPTTIAAADWILNSYP